MKNNKGFVDFGLGLLFLGLAMGSTVVLNQLFKDTKAKDLCLKQGQIQIDAALYECKKIDELEVKK